MEGERQHLLNRAPTPSPNRTGWRVKCAHVCVLLTVALERVAFYSLTGNLVLFLNKKPFGWQSYNAILASLFCVGIAFIMSFIGGIVADALLGRYKTLILSFIIYICGYTLLPLLSFRSYKFSGKYNSYDDDWKTLPSFCLLRDRNASNELRSNFSMDIEESEKPFEENCSLIIFGALFLIAIAAGSFRANIAPFGGDQTRGEGQHTTFFSWYYWSVNIGTLLALSVVAYIEQQHSFYLGYLAAVIGLGASFLVFLSGSCTYVYRPRTGSVMKNIWNIAMEALCKRKRQGHPPRSHSTDESSLTESPDSTSTELVPQCCLDYAKFRFGGSYTDSQVDDVKKLGKIICVFLTLVPYWIVYFQMQTTFLLQGLHMKLNLSAQTEGSCNNTKNHFSNKYTSTFSNSSSHNDKHGVQVVAVWLTLFDVVFVIILIPIVDRFIYHRLAQAGRSITIVKRICFGMVFSLISMIIAGVVEHKRLKLIFQCDDGTPSCSNITVPQYIDGTLFSAANMSVFWQIPQYALIGISEVFACVAGLDLAYQMAPRSMKAIIMGLFYLFSGVGSFLGVATMFMFENVWFFNGQDFGNINCRVCNYKRHPPTVEKECHLDFYFFFLAGVQLFGIMCFLLVVKKLKLSEDLGRLVSQRENQQTSVANFNTQNGQPSNNLAGQSGYGRTTATSYSSSIQRPLSAQPYTNS